MRTEWLVVMMVAACGDDGAVPIDSPIDSPMTPVDAAIVQRAQQAYVKPPTISSGDGFGISVSTSGDGNTLVVGSSGRAAALVYTRSGSTWSFQTSVTGSNTSLADSFGGSVALSADGNTLLVGASGEESAATGINNGEADNSLVSAGAAYVFIRTANSWTQQAYIKASNTNNRGFFGGALAISSDGNTITIGSSGESSAATGINGNGADISASEAGAAYVFSRSGSTWTQQAYVKASNTEMGDIFGVSVALSADGNTLAVGAANEASAATGIDGNQTDNSASGSGAIYVFTRSGTTWSQTAYVKASNTQLGDQFGVSVALSGVGDTLAAGAPAEDSSGATAQADNSFPSSGALYVFTRATTWSQQAYLKTAVPDMGDQAGNSVVLSQDGRTLVAGSWNEDSAATGVNGDATNNGASNSGAAWVFNRSASTWSQESYLKASNTDPGDSFAFNLCALAVSSDGTTIAVGAPNEQSATSGINGVQTDNSLVGAGAVYVFR